MNTTFSTIDELLGDSTARYFGEGHKGYTLQLVSLDQAEKRLAGVLDFGYSGPARPRGEEVHLGSIEYTALTLYLAGIGLSRLAGLSIEQINASTLDTLHVQIAQPLYTGSLPFEIELHSSHRHLRSKQGSRSIFVLKIGGARVRVCVDHQGRQFHWLTAQQQLDPFATQLYNLGYKQRSVSVRAVRIALPADHIDAQVHFANLLDENEVYGIGSARNMLLPTDVIQVFGQLMQALLYRRMQSDRQRCPNIWLRQMAIQCDRPVLEACCEARVHFDRVSVLRMGDHDWQTIDLSGRVGTYTGTFKIAHQLPQR